MRRCPVQRRQCGFSIVSAIFLMVVLSSLAAWMVSIAGVQTQTSSYAVVEARVYHAARSGIEWARYNIVNAGSCGVSPATIAGFNVTISCSGPDVHDEAGISVNVFSVTVLAEFGSFGTADYVSRRLQSTVSLTPP